MGKGNQEEMEISVLFHWLILGAGGMGRNGGGRKGRKEERRNGGKEKAKEKTLNSEYLGSTQLSTGCPVRKRTQYRHALSLRKRYTATSLRRHIKYLTASTKAINEQSIARNLNIP